MTTDRPPGTLGTQRIEALTDGVFAIAMTLLVLELRLPEVESDASLAEALIHLAPRIAGYVLSFLVLGAYWLGLHTQYTVLRGADRVLIWITVVFLMLISAVPFTTSLLSEHSSRPIAPAIYGLHLTATGPDRRDEPADSNRAAGVPDRHSGGVRRAAGGRPALPAGTRLLHRQRGEQAVQLGPSGLTSKGQLGRSLTCGGRRS
ncbi:MAG: DUF1211 domain-containing protein [Chloroflexi bacterium]|nr:DUF1211 domain-containing protein [Chloroflexota bacterium]